MPSPRTLILSGYGLNCEDETERAFAHNGSRVDIIHINDLIDAPYRLKDYQILAIPGGFSYGDDTGSGNAFANKLRNRLMQPLLDFVARDTLTIGICNGCQILSHLGLVPGWEGTSPEHQETLQGAKKESRPAGLPSRQRGAHATAPLQGQETLQGANKIGVVYNASNRYQCRWVDVAVSDSPSPWLAGITQMHIPVGNGEGQMVMLPEVLAKLNANDQIAYRYVQADGLPAAGAFPMNPNGSIEDIAAVTDPSGRVLATMPHPERGMFFTQREDWPLHKELLRRAGKPLPVEADGMQIFANAVKYFQ